MNSHGGKPKSKTTPDPLAELRARGLVRAPIVTRQRGPLKKIKSSGPVSDFLTEQRR
jgi:hypothetical protein